MPGHSLLYAKGHLKGIGRFAGFVVSLFVIYIYKQNREWQEICLSSARYIGKGQEGSVESPEMVDSSNKRAGMIFLFTHPIHP